MPPFRLAQWTDARGFVDAAFEFLSANEVVNAVVLGVSQTIAGSNRPDNAECFFGLVYEGDQPVAAAMRTPPRGAAVTQGPPGAMKLLADALIDHCESLPGVNGPYAAVNALAHDISIGTRKSVRVAVEMRIHRLDHLAELSLADGQLRRAHAGDVDLLHGWLNDFSESIPGPEGPDHDEVLAALKLPDPRFYLWCVDDQPVSMAAWARPTENGISVNAVFTPMSNRGRGYATAVVHELSGLLLKRGYSFCTLYTDLANPTSNAIYARIGYQPVVDTRNLVFVDDPPPGSTS